MYEICENKKLSFHTIESRTACDNRYTQLLLERLYSKATQKQGNTYLDYHGIIRYDSAFRGIRLKILRNSNFPCYSIYMILNPRKVIGDFTHIGLMKSDISSLQCLEENIHEFWYELGFPFLPDQWTLSRLDIACQFQSHFGKLLIKLLHNHPLSLKVWQTRQYNRMRSFFAQSLPENVQLYDKGFKMERDNCTLYTSEDWANAENLWRFELQLHRSKIRQFEQKFEISHTGSLTDRLSAWSSRVSDILSMECAALFGQGYYRTMEQAWDLLGTRHEKIINDYFQMIANYNSVPDAWKHMKALGRTSYLTKLFREADTNPVVLPDSLIAQRERCHFPIPPLSVLFTDFGPKTV